MFITQKKNIIKHLTLNKFKHKKHKKTWRRASINCMLTFFLV